MKHIIILLFLSSSIYADSIYKTQRFTETLQEHLLINPKHIDEIVPKIKIKKPNAFQRWQMNRTGAEATYNDVTNTIILRAPYFIGSGSSLQIAGLSDVSTQMKPIYFVKASTTFHELSHADYDVHIQNYNPQFNELLSKKIKPWFKSKHPRVNAKIATHELFGYTAGDSVLGISMKINDILMSHGIRPSNKTCFPKKALIKIAARLKMQSTDIGFKDVLEISSFSNSFVPNYIYIKGRDINLNSPALPKAYKEELYQYFVDTYDFPNDSNDLTMKMNNSHYLNILKDCYSFLK